MPRDSTPPADPQPGHSCVSTQVSSMGGMRAELCPGKNLTYFSPCSAKKKKKDFNDWILVSSEAREAVVQSRRSLKRGRQERADLRSLSLTSIPAPPPATLPQRPLPPSPRPSAFPPLLPGIAAECLVCARLWPKCQTWWKARQRQPLPSCQVSTLSEPQFSPLEMGLRTDPLLHLKRWWDHIGQMPAGAWPPWEHSAGYLLLSSVHLGAGALG